MMGADDTCKILHLSKYSVVIFLFIVFFTHNICIILSHWESYANSVIVAHKY